MPNPLLFGRSNATSICSTAALKICAVIVVGAGLSIGHVVRAASRTENSSQSQNLSAKYQDWLNKDIVWIVTPEERAAFLHLRHDEERDKFMEQFWERRNPTPNGPENKAKEEHYRRIKFADEYFSSKTVPGWKSDRGRIYIVYGPPDVINAYPAGNSAGLTKPTEFWRYNLVREHGVDRKNVDFTFVDASGHDKYELQSPVKK